MAEERELTEVNCEELREQFGDYIDDEMAAEICHQLEEHIKKCPDCRIVVDKTRKTIILYQAQENDPPGLPRAMEKLQIALSKMYADEPATSESSAD